MADYWKSQEKHFCEICKCWLAKNKISIQHHESGNRHKENVKQKLRDLGQQTKEKEIERRETNSYLAQMEIGALASYKKDLQLDPQTSKTYNIHQNLFALALPKKRATSAVGAGKRPPFQPTPYVDLAHASGSAAGPSSSTNPQIYSNKNDAKSKVWAEAKTPEGRSYYWHIHTGATQWQPPDEGYLTAEESSIELGSQNVADSNTPTAETSQTSATTQAYYSADYTVGAKAAQLDVAKTDAKCQSAAEPLENTTEKKKKRKKTEREESKAIFEEVKLTKEKEERERLRQTLEGEWKDKEQRRLQKEFGAPYGQWTPVAKEKTESKGVEEDLGLVGYSKAEQERWQRFDDQTSAMYESLEQSEQDERKIEFNERTLPTKRVAKTVGAVFKKRKVVHSARANARPADDENA